ncbi:MAG: T9SS type A sorting domain-containing protein [Paludibacter sp.]|nr:T9SS type A sorting domain-containing protein [Paludibacter sp.]
MCDITGRTLEIHNCTAESYQLNLASRTQGVYFVVVTSNNKTSVTRVIKK